MLEGNKIKLKGGKVVMIKTLDAKRLYLDTSNVAFLTRVISGENIVSVSLEDKFTISIGDQFLIHIGELISIYETKYILIDEKDKSILLFSALPTKTSIYLLPLLGKTRSFLNYDSYFVNAYLDHASRFICIMYRFTGTNRYKEFEKQLMTDPLCVSHLEHNPYHVVYIFKIPLEFKEDVVSFIEGKYSMFSKALKGRIRKFYGRDDSQPIMDVINRSKKLKTSLERHLAVSLSTDSELASKPDMEIEIYKPKGNGRNSKTDKK